MDFNKLFIETLNENKIKYPTEIVKVDYDFKLFEASDKIKSELKNLIKNDNRAIELKKLAIKNKDNVHEYLDHLYFMYEKDIERISKKYNIDFDKIANTFMEI